MKRKVSGAWSPVNKRGQTMLVKRIIGIIIALFCIIFLFKGAAMAFSLLSGEEKSGQAQSEIENLVFRLELLDKAGKDMEEPYIMLTPDRWVLVSFSKNDGKSPKECWQKNCLCICPQRNFYLFEAGANCKKGFCKTLEKDVKIKDKIKIPETLTLKSNSFYEISIRKEPKGELEEEKPEEEEKEEAEKEEIKKITEIIIRELTSGEKETLDNFEKKLEEKGYVEIIGKASEEQNVSAALLKAIMYHESIGGQEKAVSYCGAAGLMQFMPATARGYELTNIFEDANFACCSGCPELSGGHAKRLREAIKDKSLEEIKQIDDRLNPEKSIPAAAKFIKFLENIFGDNTLAIIAAYNAGHKKVKDECPTSEIEKCATLPKETRRYYPLVGAYYNYFLEKETT